MREIKFRVWYTAQNRMVTDCRLGEMDEEYEDYAIFMQYTGLKDKNGVEIYEGDIVRGNPNKVVVYQAPSFVMKEKIKIGYSKYWTSFLKSPIENQFDEVIGNIYENKELL